MCRFFLVSSLFVLFRFGRRRRTCLFSASKVYSDQYYRLCLVLPFNEEYIGVFLQHRLSLILAGGTRYYSETALTGRRDFVLDRKLRVDPASTEPCLKSLEFPQTSDLQKGEFRNSISHISFIIYLFVGARQPGWKAPCERDIAGQSEVIEVYENGRFFERWCVPTTSGPT